MIFCFFEITNYRDSPLVYERKCNEKLQIQKVICPHIWEHVAGHYQKSVPRLLFFPVKAQRVMPPDLPVLIIE